MKPYPSYKDSGVEWIGEIPNDWNVKRLKYITTSRKDKSEDGSEELLSVSEYLGVVPRSVIREGEDHLTRSESLEGYLKVSKGNLVNNIMLMWKRGLGVSDYDGIVSPSYSVFSFNNCSSKYFHYLLRTDLYITEFRKNSTGIIDSRLRLYDDDFGNIYSYFPSLPEQKQIVSFLDHKTQSIDELIEKTEQKIELLKEKRTSLINHCVTKGLNPEVEMKDSGVEWIGEIPINWLISPLKYCLKQTKYSIKTGPFGSQLKLSDFVSDGYKVYNQRTVYDDDYQQGDLFIDEEKFKSLKEFEVFPNDILITSRGTIGKGSLVPKGIRRGVLHPCLIRIQMDEEKLLNDYSLWFINHSDCFITSVGYESNSTTIDVIYSNTLKSVIFTVPPLSEQHQIVEYLDEQTKNIDSTIEKETKRIELLKEFRQSLISEVVTGKIDVRDWNS